MNCTFANGNRLSIGEKPYADNGMLRFDFSAGDLTGGFTNISIAQARNIAAALLAAIGEPVQEPTPTPPPANLTLEAHAQLIMNARTRLTDLENELWHAKQDVKERVARIEGRLATIAKAFSGVDK